MNPVSKLISHNLGSGKRVKVGLKLAVIILSPAIGIHCFNSQYFKLCVEIHLHRTDTCREQ